MLEQTDPIDNFGFKGKWHESILEFDRKVIHIVELVHQTVEFYYFV